MLNSIDKKSDLRIQKKYLGKLYKSLGKLCFNYQNKNISILKYKKQSKKLYHEIMDAKINIEIAQNLEIHQHKKNLDGNRHSKKNILPSEPMLDENGYNLYKFCEKCGIGNNPDSKICIYCGEKFNK